MLSLSAVALRRYRAALRALDLLPEHAELSRAEPGNLRFDLAQTETR